jgi:hypothetical protein
MLLDKLINLQNLKRMKNRLLLALVACLLAECAMNMLTGRNQVSLVQESELQLMAVDQYKTFLDENKVFRSSNREAAMVDRVGARISNAITTFYNNKGQGSVLERYQWEFNTIDGRDQCLVHVWR